MKVVLIYYMFVGMYLYMVVVMIGGNVISNVNVL